MHDVDTIVFDILGTLVDDTAGLRAALADLVPAGDVDDLVALWRATVGAGHRPAWPDTAAALADLAAGHELIGLSNADRTALLRMNASAGLRWHTALSTEAVRSYKPDPAVYRMAIECAGRPPERMLMVAAHAWDLRGARAAGMRTAYVDRPGADAPTAEDRFDVELTALGDLGAVLSR